MKNFKKVLALVLVVAMALTMVTMASAKFTDGETITKTEAVDVLSTIGVIKGYEDGSFKPTGEVTRAEMAKMIATIINKGEDVGEIYKGACTFADTASHWAAGYVAFCAQEKIIAGKNATTFKPDDKVTGTEAAKMLLVALGYDPNGIGLVGASWASNTLSYARKAGTDLLQNVDGTLSANLNRENAAQMMLNALQANMVEADGNGTTISLGTLGTITTGVKHNLLACDGPSFEGAARRQAQINGVMQPIKALADAFETLKKKATTDAAGKAVSAWTFKGNDVGNYSPNAYLTYTGEVYGGTIYADLGKIDVKDNTTTKATYYCDGLLMDQNYIAADPYHYATIITSNCLDKIFSGSYNVVGGNGSKIEIYYDTTVTPATLNIVETRTYVGAVKQAVAAVKTSAGDIQTPDYVVLGETDQTAGHPVFVKALGAYDFSTKTAGIANGFETSDFARADATNHTVVAYTLGKTEAGHLTPGDSTNIITSVAKATTASGDVTTYGMNAGNVAAITVGGQEYKVSALGYVGTPSIPSTATVFMDAQGFVLASDAVESGNYAYVMDINSVTDDFGASNGYKARLLKTDGTVAIVNADGIGIDGAAIQKFGTNAGEYDPVANGLRNKVVSYTTNSTTGNYTFYKNSMKQVDAGVGSYTFEGKPMVAALANTVVNANTNFIIGTYDASSLTTTYTTYTGITAVPGFTTSNASGKGYNGLSAITDGTGNALYVFAPEADLKQASTGNLMIAYKCSSVAAGLAYSADAMTFTSDYTSGYYTGVRAVIDGEVKTLKMDGTGYAALKDANDFNVIQSGTVDKNGVYTNFTLLKDTTTNTMYASQGVAKLTDKFGTWEDWNNGVVTIDYEKIACDGATPVFVFNETDGKVTKTDAASFYTYIDPTTGLSIFDGGVFVLDSASAAVGTTKINALYVKVTK